MWRHNSNQLQHYYCSFHVHLSVSSNKQCFHDEIKYVYISTITVSCFSIFDDVLVLACTYHIILFLELLHTPDDQTLVAVHLATAWLMIFKPLVLLLKCSSSERKGHHAYEYGYSLQLCTWWNFHTCMSIVPVTFP